MRKSKSRSPTRPRAALRNSAPDVWEDTLRALKRELQDFNITTGKWKAKA